VRQLGVEPPIEVLEGLVAVLEVGLAEARGEGAIGASLDLVAEQQLEELGVAEVLLLGLICNLDRILSRFRLNIDVTRPP